MVFNKLDYSWLFVYFLDYHQCLTILKVPYLLREDPMALFAPTNQPRIKCETTQLHNSFDKILVENVRYSVAVENITVGETRDMVKAFAMLLCVFYIFNLEYRSLKQHFYLFRNCFCEFQINVKCHRKY